MRNYTVHREPGHVPMRIVAAIEGEVVYLGDGLHIDGPLAHAAYYDLDRETRSKIPPVGAMSFPLDFDLPLSRWSVEYEPVEHDPIHKGLLDDKMRIWGWCATAADEEKWLARGKFEVRKRPPLKDFARYTSSPSANVGAGHLKAYDLAYPTVVAAEIEWYALGDPDRVRYLLTKYVRSIGKKRHLGGGTMLERRVADEEFPVSSWLVEPTDVNTDGVLVDGKLARRMPAGAAEGAWRMGAIRPPYWHHSRVVGSVEP